MEKRRPAAPKMTAKERKDPVIELEVTIVPEEPKPPITYDVRIVPEDQIQRPPVSHRVVPVCSSDRWAIKL